MNDVELQVPPLSLYVHLPWCVRKCPYCDFNSHVAGEHAPRGRYIDTLLIDLEREARRCDDRELRSIFLGGGTPSFFSPAEIARLLDGVRQHFDLIDNIEITMEANPGTLECGDPRGYRDAGVNRLSIGAQSFNDACLETLGRIHSVADIRRSYADAREAGIGNINLDLMHALPGQGVADALNDLQEAIALQPEHLSWYQLTLEPNTVFYSRPPSGLPDNDLAFEIQERGQALLERHGYARYEVSAYAKDGRRCEHNLNYWTFGDYVAVGAGAHGKLSKAGDVWRYVKPAHPLQYMEAIEKDAGDDDLVRLEPRERVFEYMLNVLRLTDGFAEAQFQRRTGIPAGTLGDELARLREKQLVDEIGRGIWRVTDLGQRFLNDVQATFLP